MVLRSLANATIDEGKPITSLRSSHSARAGVDAGRQRRELGECMASSESELNLGQLRMLIRAKFLVDAKGLNKVQGKPFTVSEVMHTIREIAS